MDTEKKEKLQNRMNTGDYLDLWPIVNGLCCWIWLALLIGILVAGTTYFVTTKFVPKTYTSSFSTYINNKAASDMEVTTVNNGDLTTSKYLGATYVNLLASNRVLLASNEYLQADYTYETLDKMVDVQTSSNTGIIVVTVTSTDPTEAYDLANAIKEITPSIMEEVIEGSSMKVIDQPIFPDKPSGPNYLFFALVGGAGGFALVSLIIIIVFLFDKRIKGVNDLENRTNLIVIGTIHDWNGATRKPDQDKYSYASIK